MRQAFPYIVAALIVMAAMVAILFIGRTSATPPMPFVPTRMETV